METEKINWIEMKSVKPYTQNREKETLTHTQTKDSQTKTNLIHHSLFHPLETVYKIEWNKKYEMRKRKKKHVKSGKSKGMKTCTIFVSRQTHSFIQIH